jgi:hypothetical protein
MKIEARYKDFNPIIFEVGVKYMSNLDGKKKFFDIGSHVFFKNLKDRPQIPYKFELANILNDGIDDDYDNYDFALNDGLENYYEMEDRDNIISIPLQDSHTFPKVGKNLAKVTSKDHVF